MAKYHISPATGNPGVCRAKSACPFGGAEAHFPTREEAAAAYESTMNTAPALTKATATIEEAKQRTLALWSVNRIPTAADGTTFEQAWAREFEPLTQPSLQEVNVSRELDKELGLEGLYSLSQASLVIYDPEDDTYEEASANELLAASDHVYAAVDAPTGGGNRECWCEDDEHTPDSCPAALHEKLADHPQLHAIRQDVDDPSSATYYFSPAKEPSAYGELKASEHAYKKQANAAAILESFEIGEIAPWRVLPVNPSTEKLARAKYEELRALETPRNRSYSAVGMPTKAHQDDLKAIQKAVNAGAALPEPKANWRPRTFETAFEQLEKSRQKREKLAKKATALTTAKAMEEAGTLPAEIATVLTDGATLDQALAKAQKAERSEAAAAKRMFTSYLGREKDIVNAQMKFENDSTRLRKEYDQLMDARQWPGKPATMPKRK